MIKKLRQLNNMNILFITNSAKLKSKIESNLQGVKSITFVDNTQDDLSLITFDLMLIDFDFEGCLEIMNQIKVSKPSLPKIVLLSDHNEKNILASINSGAYSVLSTQCSLEDLKLSMIVALNQTKRVDKINFDENIYYDFYRERFYNREGEIPFTKFEFQVLRLLLENNQRVTGYDEIKRKVWKEKKMSIFTMRNVVNKIRKKTYYDIIRNISSNGYQIDTPK